MAAYAAVVSVMHIIEQVQNHPRPPISLDKEQLHSLTQNVTLFQDFLENYPASDALESRIADAAYAAEDIIESRIVDQILAVSKSQISSIDLYEGLQKVITEMESVKKEVVEITENTRIKDEQLHSTGSFIRRSPSSLGNNTMVGFDDFLIEVMDKLTGQQSDRQIMISIVGMGGIGKTTLARNVYVNPLIIQYFDFRGWATISQEYNSKDILLEILVCLNIIRSRESFVQMSEDELGDKLYKCLFGRRYLVVMDDIWSIDAWNKVKTFFPNNNGGSAIMLTTRLSKLAFELSGSCRIEMSFLDENQSWNLFCKIVFVEKGCPLEFEEIGKKIAKSCNGLPLSITVIGGLLSKYTQSPEYWEYILENINPILNSEDNGHCLRILRMSYKELPVHLKPCFLYMGVFPEDHEIHISRLIKLWVAEGFLKPISGKSLEMVAEEYLQDLLDRNLILVHEFGSIGKIKYCKIHDLLRDLCLKEAHRDKFLCFKRPHYLKFPHDIQSQLRISCHQCTSCDLIGILQSASLRSLICDFADGAGSLPFLNFRLLRVLLIADKIFNYKQENNPPKTIFQLINLRFLESGFHTKTPLIFSSVCHLWNLQTLVVRQPMSWYPTPPFDIWKMPQLRHVKIDKLALQDPPMDDDSEDDFIVLGKLQTLKKVYNFKCGEEVVKRIPNIKKLKIYYAEGNENYCLNNLCRLCKLKSLSCEFYSLYRSLSLSLMLPHSLKKLNLKGTEFHWKDMATKIGSLPLLQVLKLELLSFIGPEWETVEGQFRRLKYLLIEDCYDLEYWRTESTHFPCLEHLLLKKLFALKEIPLEIGDITTLKSIEVYCSDSAVISAKEIVNKQEDLGNEEGLQVRVLLSKKNQALQSLASPNFQITII